MRAAAANILTLDLTGMDLREVNRALQGYNGTAERVPVRILEPRGAHALACGLDAPLQVEILGHTGYYCAGMNKHATITIHGNAGPGVAENIMSGLVRVKGDASQYAGASGHGGLVVIEGSASSRCGISMKGVDIVVGRDVGHMSAFMAQAGRLVVLGDAGPDLGDSIYEARLYVRGRVASLGADCIEKEMRAGHLEELEALLERADMDADPREFRRYGSARTLYNFHIDHAGAY
jgi:methylamine---glutamate N-methyltransferase subunit B